MTDDFVASGRIQTFKQRGAHLRNRAWHVVTRRGNALRFLPDTTVETVARLRDAGFVDTAVKPAPRFVRTADHLTWEAALIGTPPQGEITLDLDGLERLTRLRSWDRRAVASLLSSLLNAHIHTHRSCLADPAFWTRALDIVRRVGIPYLVIGDSHSLCACIVGASINRPIVPIHILCTAGSASGLANPTSRSGYGSMLSRLADALRASRADAILPIFLQFGQVDVEFVSVFHRIARSEAIFERAHFDAFCDKAVGAYASFLTRTFSGFGAVQVVSIFPPALADAAWAEGYTNAHVAELEGDRHTEEMTGLVRSIAIPTLVERTALHRHFNDRLAAMCREGRWTFLDLFDRFIGGDGIIAARFNRFSRGFNHHICIPAARSMIRPAVELIIDRAGGQVAAEHIARRSKSF